MAAEVTAPIDIDNGNVDNWVVEYLGGEDVLTFLKIAKKSKRREALDVMLKSEKYKHLKDKVKFDARGKMKLIFPTERHKTLAMLK